MNMKDEIVKIIPKPGGEVGLRRLEIARFDTEIWKKYNSAMDKKEDNNKKDFMPKAQVDIMLEGIRSDFKVFGEKIEMMDGRLMNVENRLVNVEEKVDLILEDIDILKSRTVDMKNMKAEKEITDNHEKRILKLEKASLSAA